MNKKNQFDKKSTNIKIRVTTNFLIQLQSLAKINGLGMSEYIRTLVNAEYNKEFM